MRKWNASILLLGFFHYGPDYWWSKWAVLLILLALDLGIRIGRALGLAAGACFTWTALSGLYVFAWRDNYVQGFDKLLATSMDATAAYTTTAFLLLSFFALGLPTAQFVQLRRAFGWACLADSGWTLLGAWAGSGVRTSVGGFFDQYSMNGCFLPLTAPFLLELFPGRSLKDKAVKLLPFAAMVTVLLIGRTRSVLAVALVVSATMLLMSKHPFKKTFVGAGITALFSLLPFLPSTTEFTRDRFPIARHVFTWLWDKPWPYPVFGMGNGSFFIFGPGIQRLVGFQATNGNWFLWMHSDWGQTAFELGLVGLALYLWLAWDCFSRARRSRDHALTASFLGFCATAVFQYPVHVPLMALLGFTLVISCLRADGTRPLHPVGAPASLANV